MEEGTIFVVDGITYATLSDDAVEVSRNPRVAGDVVIPEFVEYDGARFRVVKVGMMAFFGNREVATIVLPDSVTEIDEAAFSCCGSLTAVNIPEGVSQIPYEAFYGCESLNSLFLPDSVRRVEDRALWYCRGLETISIPKHLLGVCYPKLLPKRAADGGQCRALDSLRQCLVRLPGGEVKEFDVE